MWENLKPLDLSKIEIVPFPDDQYFHEIYSKTQICIHHTISGDGVDGDISTWEDDPSLVGTCIIIDRAGTPWQLFSSKYWAYHLGAGNHVLDRHSIGVELDNWGWLIPGDGTVKQFGKKKNGQPKMVQTELGRYYTYYGYPEAVPLQHYPNKFRGYEYYEKYSDSQLKTVGELILFWHNKYGIPLDYHEDMWDVSPKALDGTSGIWTHCSYRPASDKTDCHPQPELIELLKALKYIK